jgi:EAL and modified HD-GYP domain-containing signal transduction protein
VDAFIARQPVFDRHREVRGYELLFRDGFENAAREFDPDQASSRVIADAIFLPHLATLTSGKLAFVNLTREALLQGWSELLPPQTTVLEVLESVMPDDEIVAECRRLKTFGYRIAFDDFAPGSPWEPMLELADIVKVDVLANGKDARRKLVRSRGPACTMLAEKVETQEMMDEVVGLGYGLLQGNYFARPEMVVGRDIPASQQSCLRMLRELHRPELDLAALAGVIEHEVALSYKLLRYVRASAFGWRGPVASIRHALTLLGARESRRWGTVITLSWAAAEGSEELVREALRLGRMCELIAPRVGFAARASDLFFLGLFSRLDVILQQPMARILDEVPIAEDAKAALEGSPGLLRSVLDLGNAYMTADWAVVEQESHRLRMASGALPALFTSALEWCDMGYAGPEQRQAA